MSVECGNSEGPPVSPGAVSPQPGTEAVGRPGAEAVHVSLAEASALGPPPPDSLSVPIYTHGSLLVKFYQPVGEDLQKPHDRDEVYVVTSGSGTFWDGVQRHAVCVGSFLFVPARRPHRFEAFTSDFAVWVLFYSPEGGEADPRSAAPRQQTETE
jgi:mannose-6-phosphate isomerase-like protein (cupin superfamily)